MIPELFQNLLSVFQQISAFLFVNFGGILLITTAIIAAAAYKRSSEVAKNQRAMERLADAIIKHQTKTTKEVE